MTAAGFTKFTAYYSPDCTTFNAVDKKAYPHPCKGMVLDFGRKKNLVSKTAGGKYFYKL